MLRAFAVAFCLNVSGTAQSAVGHDDAYAYRLPYQSIASVPVLQGYGSHFSHRGSEHYTVDFGMAEGTRVLVARDGVVSEVESSQNHSCWSKGCGRYANRVSVLHDDGSIARYFHLAPDSVLVKPGERVRRGQALALSGNTGLTTTPHLHFGVYVEATDGVLQSLPVRFATSDGVIELRRGRRYRSPHRSPPAQAGNKVVHVASEPVSAVLPVSVQE